MDFLNAFCRTTAGATGAASTASAANGTDLDQSLNKKYKGGIGK